MKPRDLAAAIRKRGWLIIAITVLAALIATVVARVQTPVYKVELSVSAVAPLNPTNKQPEATVAGAYVYIMPSIASAAEGMDVAKATSEALAAKGIDISAEELLDKVKAEAEVQASYMKITFADSSPTRVAEIANTWGEMLETMTGDDVEKQNADLKNLVLSGKLVVTNEAIPPSKPAQPKPLVYLGLGIFVGLVLGFGLVIGIEFFDPHFRSPQEVEETLEIPVMGVIPRLKEAETTTLLSSRATASPVHDAYSQLRTTIMFTLADRPFKSALVVPAIPTPDGPYIPANLAISIAYTERRTLLIDADMREKAVSRLFKAADKPGLADSLGGGDHPELKVIETGIPYLDFLPAGITSEASSDLLSLPLMDEYLRDLEDSYDRVIISAPPLTSSVDGVIVSSKTDLSLVVLDAQRCSRKIALTAMETYELLNMKPSGAVLSNVKVSRRERALYAQKPAAAPPGGKPEAAAPSRRERKAAEAAAREERKAAEEAAATAAGASAPAMPERELKPPRVKPPKPERGKEKKAILREAGKPPRVRPAPEVPPPRRDAVPEREEAPTAPEAPKTQARARSTEDELQQMQAIVADDFRRLGATGAPIPKQWLRALNSEKAEVRESARVAISAYYESFLARYKISEEDRGRITESIIMMMRKEGEFATMNEAEAQKRLQKMLIDAGAKFSTRPSPQTGAREPRADEEKAPGEKGPAAPPRAARDEEKRTGKEEGPGAGEEKAGGGDEDYADWE